MSKHYHSFIPLTKIDLEQRLVFGLATCEKKDRSGEIMDYETSKPFYQKWSTDQSEASGGKSLGNVRAMHGKVAAGKLTEITFNDTDKAVEVCAKVVDDAEWDKVKEGVYTGFSHGGSYGKVWTDDQGDKRYTAIPIEISLVDTPCLPDATFKVIKMEKGAKIEEERAFVAVIEEPNMTEIGNRADQMAKAAGGDWREFTDEARTAIMQERIDAEFEKALPATEKDDGGEDPKKRKKDEKSKPTAPPEKKSAKKYVEPTQVWKCNCAEHAHLSKVEAVSCMKSDIAADAAEQATAPLTEALAKLSATLGDAPVVDDPTIALRKFIDDWKVGDEIPAAQVDAMVKVVADGGEAFKDIADAKAPEDIIAVMKKALAVKAPALEKGLYTVSRFCSLISELKWLFDDSMFEAQYEGDDSGVPDQIKAGIKLLIDALQNMVVEECTELFPDDLEDVEVVKMAKTVDAGQLELVLAVNGDALKKHVDALKKAVNVEVDYAGTIAHLEKTRDALPETAKIARDQLDKCAAFVREMSKVGARNSKKDADMIQQMHDMASALGASCGDSGDDVGKGTTSGDLAKLENVALRKQLTDIIPQIETLTKQVADLRAQPMPGKARLTLVDKGLDPESDPVTLLAKKLEGMTPDERALELIKLSLKTGTNGHPAHSGQ